MRVVQSSLCKALVPGCYVYICVHPGCYISTQKGVPRADIACYEVLYLGLFLTLFFPPLCAQAPTNQNVINSVNNNRNVINNGFKSEDCREGECEIDSNDVPPPIGGGSTPNDPKVPPIGGGSTPGSGSGSSSGGGRLPPIGSGATPGSGSGGNRPPPIGEGATPDGSSEEEQRCSRANEFFDKCGGCEATCDNPNPFCTAICDRDNARCRCRNGFVRHPNGRCVRESGCPSTTPSCGSNEIFDECGGCEATCDRPNPTCSKICRSDQARCRCADGFVRHPSGRCVRERSCPSTTPTCGRNEIFDECGGCEGTCSRPNSSCPFICGPGACRCRDGFLRHPDGTCIRQSQCPANNPSCPRNEFFDKCGTCEGTCIIPNPICPAICDFSRARCRCLHGLVRNSRGDCVPKSDCAPTCNRNEVFNRCSSGCEGTCSIQRPSCMFAPQACRFQQCECPVGQEFVRDTFGRCVHISQCPAQNPPTTPAPPRPTCRNALCPQGYVCSMKRPASCPICAEQPTCVRMPSCKRSICPAGFQCTSGSCERFPCNPVCIRFG